MSASLYQNRLRTRTGHRLWLRTAAVLFFVYLFVGPNAIQTWLVRKFTAVSDQVSQTIDHWKLNELKARIIASRASLNLIQRERDSLQSNVVELEQTRDRLRLQLQQTRASTETLMVALTQADDETIDVGERRYRAQDVRLKADDWMLRSSDLERLLAETEDARSQLLSGIIDLDQRISDGRRQLELLERKFEIELARSAGSKHRDNVIRRLGWLETHTGH